MNHGALQSDGFEPDFVRGLRSESVAGGGRLYLAGTETPSVLFVHGGFHGAWCFGGWMRRLAETGTASAALDLRGHGFLAAEGLPLETGTGDHAAMVVRAAGLLPKNLTLVGHSLGGLIAAMAASELSLSALVLVAPSPPGNLPGAKAVPEVSANTLAPPPDRQAVITRFLGGEEPRWVGDFEALLCRESPEALNDRYRLRTAVNPVRLPKHVLVLEAGLDCSVRHPAGQDRAVATFYGGDHRVLPEAPHCMMLGKQAFASLQLITDWCASIGLSRNDRASNAPSGCVAGNVYAPITLR